MFGDFFNVHKYIWSMKKKKKPRGYDHQPADPPPHLVELRSKIQCFLGGEEEEGAGKKKKKKI